MRELFEKSSLILPQKLPDNLFLYRAFHSFSTGGIVPAIGPQLPNAGCFVYQETEDTIYLSLDREGQRDNSIPPPTTQEIIVSFTSYKTKRPATGSWGPVAGVFVSVEKERNAR